MRRALFYTISLTCALAINIALIGLLIFASPKNNSHTEYKQFSTQFTLSQNKTPAAPLEKIEQTATNIENQPSQIVIQPTRHSPLVAQQQAEEHNFEQDHFFYRGQQILASLEEIAPQATPGKKPASRTDHLTSSKSHCYCTKTLNHIAAYYASLKKRNAKTLAHWYEHPRSKPDITVHVSKDGSLKSVLLTKSSGSSMHDKLYVQAIKQAAPFPKIPDHFHTNELVFEL